jgi:hypothetical protein
MLAGPVFQGMMKKAEMKVRCVLMIVIITNLTHEDAALILLQSTFNLKM